MMAWIYTLVLINIINFFMNVYLIAKKNDSETNNQSKKKHIQVTSNDNGFGNPFASYQNKQNLYEPIKPFRGVKIEVSK